RKSVRDVGEQRRPRRAGPAHRRRRAGARRLIRIALRVAHRRSVGRSFTMAEEKAMTSRTRAFVLSITAPVVAFALVGGMLGRATTGGLLMMSPRATWASGKACARCEAPPARKCA